MHQTGHNRYEVVLDPRLQAAKYLESLCGALWHLVEFHDQVFDDTELNPRITRETISIVTNLEDGGFAAFGGEDGGVGIDELG